MHHFRYYIHDISPPYSTCISDDQLKQYTYVLSIRDALIEDHFQVNMQFTHCSCVTGSWNTHAAIGVQYCTGHRVNIHTSRMLVDRYTTTYNEMHVNNTLLQRRCAIHFRYHIWMGLLLRIFFCNWRMP